MRIPMKLRLEVLAREVGIAPDALWTMTFAEFCARAELARATASEKKALAAAMGAAAQADGE